MKQYTELSQDERYEISRCFKSDTVIDKNHKGAILTLVDRKILYVDIVHLGATNQNIRFRIV